MTNPKPKRRWYHPRLNWVLFSLLAVEGFLFLSEQAGWFGLNEDKVMTLGLALAAVIVSMLSVFLWIVACWGFRRRFQFSLRTLLLVVTLCALACSRLAVKMQQAKRQQVAVTEIKELGGTVTYDWQIDADGHSRPNAQPPGPVWLRNVLGDDCFGNVTVACLPLDPHVWQHKYELRQALPTCRFVGPVTEVKSPK